MTRTFGTPPTADDIEAIARATIARLPRQFAEHLADVVLQVEDFADDELLDHFDLDDPFDLTGVYQGLPLGAKSIDHTGTMPDRIRLFRRPILEEWAARGDETLERLVAHVTIHEIGHHFGLSDADMHALEDQARVSKHRRGLPAGCADGMVGHDENALPADACRLCFSCRRRGTGGRAADARFDRGRGDACGMDADRARRSAGDGPRAGQRRPPARSGDPTPLAALQRGRWVENIRVLAKAHWWDDTSVYRVVDNWVAQWGDGEEEKADAKPLPEGLKAVPESEYVAPMSRLEATDLADEANLARVGLRPGFASMRDAYAPLTTFQAGWPVGTTADSKWPVHCYATVGVARDLSPDTGTGAELYAVIGQAPRQLDRNIAVVGRVIEGIEYLSTLPRGTGEAGVYETEAEHTPILSVRLVSEMPEAERPRFEYLATDSASFARYVEVRANRKGGFYKVPAGGVDVCNVQVPIRRVGSSPTD